MCKSYDANGVTPRECPRAGMQLPWDGSCCKIIKVRDSFQTRCLWQTCCAIAVLQKKGQSLEPWSCPKTFCAAGLGLTSPLLWSYKRGWTFSPQSYLKVLCKQGNWPWTGNTAIAQCCQMSRDYNPQKQGEIVLSTLFFMCRDLRCQSQRDEMSADKPWYLHLFFTKAM